MYQKMTERLIRLLSRKPFLVGMVHLRALPGSPSYDNQVLPIKKVYEIALAEATALTNAGMDGLLIENMHDVPYNCGSKVGPDVVAHMTAISTLIRKEFPDIPIGVQVLAAANRQAIAVAAAADLDFVRVEGFVFSHIADEGFINSCAADLLRFRKSIEAENVSIFADVKKKHSSHAITSDISHSTVAEAARFCKADACIVTGAKTGHAPPSDVINEITSSVDIFPVIVGSGVTVDNVSELKRSGATGFIVGSFLKKDGIWSNELDPQRVNAMVERIKDLRSQRK